MATSEQWRITTAQSRTVVMAVSSTGLQASVQLSRMDLKGPCEIS